MENTTTISTKTEKKIALPVTSLRISITDFIKKFFRKDKKKTRSLLKAVSYRLLGSLSTIIISYALIQELNLSIAIGSFEFVGKIVLFYVHERVWEKI